MMLYGAGRDAVQLVCGDAKFKDRQRRDRIMAMIGRKS